MDKKCRVFYSNIYIIMFLLTLTYVECTSKEVVHSPETCSDNVPLLILVHSAPSHFELRESMRKTWTINNPDYRTVFIIGHSFDKEVEDKVFQEVEAQKDILFIDIVDSYRNLTLKHMLAYDWAIENCPKAEYVLKTDDDVFVDTIHLPTYLHYNGLDKKAKRENFILCFAVEDAVPVRDPNSNRGKWFLTREEYPREDYPPYCSGTAYLTTISSMKLVLEATKKLPFNFIDDLLLTGLAVEQIYLENNDKNPSKVVELYDWAEVFLARHTSDKERLFDKDVAYFSPMLMAAFDLTPEQMQTLYNKSVMCYKHQDKCYGKLYDMKNPESSHARNEMSPKRIVREKGIYPKLEL